MTPPLELAKDAFASHLALEMFDGPLDALVADLDFEGSTLNGFTGNRQGAPHIAESRRCCKPRDEDGRLYPTSGQPTSLGLSVSWAGQGALVAPTMRPT